MWKLLEPRSTAASTSGTVRAEGVSLASAGDRAVGASLTRDAGASGGEGGTATARRRGVRVADDELGAVQAFAIVDLGAGEIHDAHGIDEELHTLVFHAGVPLLGLLVELEAVLKPGAAAALHENAQHQLRVALPADEIAHLAGRRIRE